MRDYVEKGVAGAIVGVCVAATGVCCVAYEAAAGLVHTVRLTVAVVRSGPKIRDERRRRG